MQIKIIGRLAHEDDKVACADDDGLGIDVGEQRSHDRRNSLWDGGLRHLVFTLEPTHPLIVGALGVRAPPSAHLCGNQPQIFRFCLTQVHISARGIHALGVPFTNARHIP